MQYQLSSNMNYKQSIFNAVGWLFGLLVVAIGLINIFWGNDQAFGAFIIMLSFVYFPPANVLFSAFTGFAIPGWLKILGAVCILVGALGVGELPAKVDMMLSQF